MNIMKLTRLTAAIIAAMTAVTPLSVNSTPSTVFAEDTGAVAALPDWIPSDFESAVEFRNTYGATHIDNGLICIVCPDRARKGASEDTYGFEMCATEGMGQELKHEIYTYEYTETCFDVFVYQPWAQGDVTLTITDPHVQVKPSEKETGDDWEPPAIAEYTFTLDKNLNITETDIFSWLPDSMTEYGEYTKKNGEVSVKDNYVVFCTRTIEQFGDRWEPNSTNKNEIIKPILSSDCTMQVRDLYEDGSIDWIHVYQAVQDGNEKISWTRTSTIRPNPDEPTSYTITADCAVLDNAQTVLLPGQVKVTLVDTDTNEPIIYQNDSDTEFGYILFRECDLGDGYIENPAVTGLNTNPEGIQYADLSEEREYTFHLEQNSKVKNYSIMRDKSSIVRNDNNSYDLVFKLKFTPTGDVNDDGEFNVADVVLLQKWLLAVPDTHLINWKAVDFCNDNVLNVFDLCLMKRELLEKVQTPISVTMTQTGGVMAVHYEYKAYQDGEKYYISYLNKRSASDPVVTEITEDKFKSILSLDYAKYIGTEDPRNGKFSDEFNYHTVITYSDGTEKTTDVSISELIAMLKNWSKTSNNEW